ncbi:MAG: sarcosine oxidase subunit gamma family protein [Pseudomonadota bacterium]
MSEPASPLGGASFDGLVRITENPPRGMITLRGDLASAKLQKAVETVSGLSVPALQGAVIDGERGVCWMSPDELLILLPHADAASAVAAMSTALNGEHALAVDVSDARASFALEGEGRLIRETLAKLSPADLRMQSLPTGMLRRTRLAQVPAAFYLASETKAELICFRSVAAYVFGILRHAATPGGEVGYLP